MMYHPLGSYVSFDARRRERIAAFFAGLALGLGGALGLVLLIS